MPNQIHTPQPPSPWHNKLAGKICKYTSEGAFILASTCNIAGKIPVISLVGKPLYGAFTIIAFATWRGALAFDPNSDRRKMSPERREKMRLTEWYDKGCSYLGIFAGVSIIAGLIFPPIAPIAWGATTLGLLGSNILWTVRTWVDLDNERKNLADNEIKNLRVVGKAAYLVYSSLSTISLGLFALGVVLTPVFPPLGGILFASGMGALAIAGLGLAGAFACKYLAKKGAKVMQMQAVNESEVKVESKNENKNKLKSEVEPDINLKNNNKNNNKNDNKNDNKLNSDLAAVDAVVEEKKGSISFLSGKKLSGKKENKNDPMVKPEF